MCLPLNPHPSKYRTAVGVLSKWDLATRPRSVRGHGIRRVLSGPSSFGPCPLQGPAPIVYLPGQVTFCTPVNGCPCSHLTRSLVSPVTGALQPFSPGCTFTADHRPAEPPRSLLWLLEPGPVSARCLDAVPAPCCQERGEDGASERLPPHTCLATCAGRPPHPAAPPAHCGLRARISLPKELSARKPAPGLHQLGNQLLGYTGPCSVTH